MKRIFSLSMLIVGTIIGAGFASGKEIVSFFGSPISPVIAPLVGVGIFCLCYMFCNIGRKFKCADFGEVNQKLLGKLHVVADAFLLLNSLIVLSGMLSGMDSLFNPIFPIAPAYSIFSGVLCALIVLHGIKGLLKGNSIIVPFIIVFIVLICGFNLGEKSFIGVFYPSTFPSVIIYVCMNIMLACTVLTTVDETPKTVFWASLIAAVIMTALMTLIIIALNNSQISGDMPLVSLAIKSKPLYFFAVAAVATSIFTTMMTAMSGLSNWLTPLTGSKRFAVVATLLSGLIVSNLGFNGVVAYLYPVIGIVGLIYTVLCAIFLIKRSRKTPETPRIKQHVPRLTPLKQKLFGKRNAEIHDGGEEAKNHR